MNIDKRKKLIKNFSFSMLSELLKSKNLPEYRAKQIFKFLYDIKCSSFQDISVLPKSLRDEFEAQFELNSLVLVKKQDSADGTIKFLFRLRDGLSIESVLMPDDEEAMPGVKTLCISSMAGCSLGCAFCATGTLGFNRNLETAEIIDQALMVEKITGKPLNNIVFMGMGEPLMNYKNVSNALDIFTHDESNLFSRKKITLSTSGIAPRIEQLAKISKPVKLAISLHATTQGLREMLMPVAASFKLSRLLTAVETYYREARMPITYEYILFEGLNDTEKDAKRLAKIARRVPSRINLIPFNDISFTQPEGIAAELKPASNSQMNDFANQVRSYGVPVIVRNTTGQDIAAACGQLALEDKPQNFLNIKVDSV